MKRRASTGMEASGCIWRTVVGLFVILGLVAVYLALSRAYEGSGGTSVPATAADHHDNPGG
jgi:hypothetical protein